MYIVCKYLRCVLLLYVLWEFSFGLEKKAAGYCAHFEKGFDVLIDQHTMSHKTISGKIYCMLSRLTLDLCVL